MKKKETATIAHVVFELIGLANGFLPLNEAYCDDLANRLLSIDPQMIIQSLSEVVEKFENHPTVFGKCAHFVKERLFITLDEFKGYLAKIGWQLIEHPHPNRLVYQKSFGDDVADIVLPSHNALCDYYAAMIEAFNLLALLEEVEPDELFRSIKLEKAGKNR